MKDKIYVNVGKTGILFASEEPVELKGLQDNCNEEYIRAKTLLEFLDELKDTETVQTIKVFIKEMK